MKIAILSDSGTSRFTRGRVMIAGADATSFAGLLQNGPGRQKRPMIQAVLKDESGPRFRRGRHNDPGTHSLLRLRDPHKGRAIRTDISIFVGFKDQGIVLP